MCTHCGLVKEKPLGEWCRRDPVDPAFGCDVWLQTPCCGHTLWAFNEAHLSLIERFVGAELREAYEGPDGRGNGTLASRLPRWMIGAHRRDDVLRACGRLRDLLGADAPS